MKYSIVMPVYKRSNVIELSFNSILKQTHKPFELIIVDNNTDIKETGILKDIIKSYRKKVHTPSSLYKVHSKIAAPKLVILVQICQKVILLLSWIVTLF